MLRAASAEEVEVQNALEIMIDVMKTHKSGADAHSPQISKENPRVFTVHER